MSTKFHGFAVRKKHFWPFHAKLRAWLLETHPILSAFALTEDNIEKQVCHLQKLTEEGKSWTAGDLFDPKLVKKLYSGHQLQLFEGPRGWWRFRVLSQDFMIENELWRDPAAWGVEDYMYDDHSDVPPEHRRRREVVLEYDKRTEVRQYLLVPVVDDDDLWHLFWDLRMEAAKRARARGLESPKEAETQAASVSNGD